MTERKIINLAERKLQRMANTPAPKIEVDIPDFITPKDITSMSDAQLEQVLNLVRLRRLQAAMIHERTEIEKKALSADKLRAQIDKKGEQVFTELDAVFKKLEKLELRVHELRALRLQAGLEF